MLAAGIIAGNTGFRPFTENHWIELAWYLTAFLPVGIPVAREAWENILEKDPFNEFTLMTIACIGAFCIGEYPEAVGVMLFYTIGETLQDGAVDKARRNISRLLDLRSEKAHVVRGGRIEDIDPRVAAPGDEIEVRPGERVPLDGKLQCGGTFDTSALTGESVPRYLGAGEEVLAGMISSDATVRIEVSREYGQSALSRILEMVENAAGRKARTELFIRRFSRVYTPIVIALAILLVAVPWIVSLADTGFNYRFSEWFSRALVFLVISCPCALVISVPLAYYAAIGAASKSGILFKGGNYIEELRKTDTVAFDKTGTLTTGRFTVEKVVCKASYTEDRLLALMAAAEQQSSHPLAKALVEYAVAKGVSLPAATDVHELAGMGTTAVVAGHRVAVGNLRLLKVEKIPCPDQIEEPVTTVIACGIDGEFAGYVTLGDTVKPDAMEAVRQLRELGVKHVVMLSGDRKEIVEQNARRLGIAEWHGELLPQDKAAYIEAARRDGRRVAFVGDGMNDAPVLALSTVGIAMGGLGSDAAIESADVVIQTDSPQKVATAIRIGRHTHTIVKENIFGAIGIKAAILILGAFGIASLWAAVFADVGVALLAVLNSMRIISRSKTL